MSGDDPASPRVVAALRDGMQGRVPPNVALMRALVDADSPAVLDRALAEAGAQADGAAARRLDNMQALWRARPEAWSLVRDILAVADHDPGQADASSPGRWAATFDRLAAVAPDAASALYALGDPGLLARATGAIVARLDGWGLVAPDRDVVEIGCGSGRTVAALAPLMRSVAGSDCSGAMLAQARRRCNGLANVRFDHTAGEGLAQQDDRSADLVLAVDVFPYLVLAGGTVAADHFAEAARVLRPGGSLMILNYSYRGDLARDQAEAADLAARHGFAVRRFATGDFDMWDGTTFWLARP